MCLTAILGGAAIGGSILSSKSQKKEANKANAVAQQTAQMNDATIREFYNRNANALSPWQQRGNDAGMAYNALLGLGTGQTRQLPPQITGAQQAPLNALGGFSAPYMGGNDFAGYQGGGGYLDMSQMQMQPQTVTNSQQDYENAFANYRNSTGYNFRLGEGVRAIDAGAPVRNSGSTLKARATFGQNIGSAEFGNYMNMLGNASGMGLSAASAQAGVGQNAANSLVSNNNMAGTNAANAALLRGQANANMWSGIGGGLGQIFGSSFG